MSSNQSSSGNNAVMQGSSSPSRDDIVRAMALALEGNECINATKYKEAVEKFTQAIAFYPDPLLVYIRATIFCTLGQYDDVINDCRKAIELDPKYANPYATLGLAFYVLKLYDEAIEAFKKAVELDPGSERSRIGLVYAEEKLKTEKQHFSTLSTDIITKTNALKIEGNECMKASKFNEAIEKYTQAISLNRDPVYFCYRPAVFCSLKKYDDADNDCRDAFLVDPDFAKAHGRMGFNFSCQGDYLAAYSAYKKALELDPTNSKYKENLALAESKLLESNP